MEEQFDNPTIVRFLEGRMPPAERQAFEARLAQDPSLALEVSFYETLLQGRDVLLKKRLRQARQNTNGQNRWRYWGGLALILGAVAIWFIWNGNHQTKKPTFCNSERYTRLAPANLLSTGISTDAATTWEAACDAYEKNNLIVALQKARSLVSDPLYADKANLLAGAAAQENGQYEMALEFYTQIKPQALVYRGKAQINTALAHHCLGQPDKGNAVLNQLANDPQMPPATQREATQLLKDLNGGK